MTKVELLKKLNNNKLSYYEKSKIYENYNKNFLNGKNEAAYYTKKEIVKYIVDNLNNINKDEITILEPSVGIGNFIPYLIKKFQNKLKINFILNDINSFSLSCLKIILNNYLKKNNITNVNIIYTNYNFLNYDFKEYNIDLIIGNPPYFTIKNKEYLTKLKIKFKDKSDNIYSYFVLHSLNISNNISLLIPKTLLYGNKFKLLRLILKNNLYKIIDFNRLAFKYLKLDTINIYYNKRNNNKYINILNYKNNENFKKEKNYLFFNEFPIWLLYRNDFFDNIFNKMKRDSFKVYRDRAITNKYLNNSTGIKVLRSQNLTKDGFIEIKNYDKYIDTKQIDLNQFSIYKKIKENKQIMIVPNLSFKPRFAILPDNCIVNGSLGLFIPNKDIKINKKDLDFYNNDEFKEYYNIIRNKSYNSINLNNEIGFFIGILKKNDE